MDKATFLSNVRFLFSDTLDSNRVLREPLHSRPGNIIDGNNKVFLLLNRRISQVDSVYNEDGDVITAYVLTGSTGKLVFTVPPTARLYVDYCWQKLTDAEIDEAIKLAQGPGNFDALSVAADVVDYATRFVVAACYRAAASKSADYYTLSAAGKQVSKSELFNHYMQLSKEFYDEAMQLRTDQRKERGDRDIPCHSESAYDCSRPYFPADGGL